MSKVLNCRLSAVLLLAVAVAFSAACKKNANTSNTTTSNAGVTTTTSGGGGGAADASSPAGALRAYHDAIMRKDFATAKRYLSANTLKLMEKGAKGMGKTVDEALRDDAQATPMTAMPEFSNEKISGDTATVDTRTQGVTITAHMVREGGEWKFAMDKTLESLGAPGMGDEPSGPAQGQSEEGGEEKDEPGGHE